MTVMPKKTLVLGASANPQRYSYLAVNKLAAHQHEVVAIGKREGNIRETQIVTGTPEIAGIDTVTLYLNPVNQKPYYDYILSLKPKRIIFNPGTENDELVEMAEKQGIKTQDACTLVMLSTGQY
ncbi:MAG: hypothetical protein JWQ27_1062 [Ferruginibacter sp.]|nr:hypothetical protein [Ferruginibacter sp.]